MDLKHLDYIVAIAEEKNISKAAQRLFSTQPALSQYLAKTEQLLGASLFQRSKKEMVLTETGKMYMKAAQSILAIGQETDALIEDIRKLRKGRITLGISQERGSVVLPAVLPKFHRLYPGIRIDIVQTNTRNLEVEAAQGRVDIAIFPVVKPLLTYKELDYEILCTDEMLLVVPNTHPYASLARTTSGKRQIVDLTLFKHEVFCLKNSGSNIRLASDSIFRDFGIIPKILLETTNTFTVHNTAVSTGSLTFIPETLSHFSELNRACVYFSVSPEQYRTTIIAAKRKGSYLSQASRDLIRIMGEFLTSIIQ